MCVCAAFEKFCCHRTTIRGRPPGRTFVRIEGRQMQQSGVQGLFALRWRQVEIDGLTGSDPARLHGGMVWRWQGEVLRLDGPQALLSLTGAKGARAPKKLRKVVSRMLSTIDEAHMRDVGDCTPEALFEHAVIVLTDGRARYPATLVETSRAGQPLVVFCDALPPQNTDLYVLEAHEVAAAKAKPSSSMMCFTPGTRIRNGQGWCPVTDLRPGDRILTRDDGLQDITWIGNSHITAPELKLRPDLRPIRLRAGAIEAERPDQDLVVSPDHRVLLRGAMAKALFAETEVLVAARDLQNDASIHRDHALKDVRYIHILLPRHAVVWANDLPCETFHPQDMPVSSLPERQREVLLEARPDLMKPANYGPTARRCLERPEAALLRGAMHMPI